jgi:putative Mg2+ transporter-C (MgtC) family protein
MMMVALGSAGFTAVAFWLYDGISASDGSTRVDPMRIVEGVAGGIGFLGAGTIIQSGGSVKGITTAATIWVVGAIGVACGVGQHLVALMLTAYAWIILAALGRLQHRMGVKQHCDGEEDASGGQ